MTGRSLLPHHEQALRDSAISDEVARERGYFSVERPRDLERLGFGRTGQIVPTLVIPVHGVLPGEDPWYIHRPDETPIKQGRPRKYLIPAGRRMGLDIHPRVRGGLSNPGVPLFITEGSKKADALVTAGAQAVIGLIGVWNWRGRNPDGGLTALGDWEYVALKEGRQVYVVFDSDVMLKEPVRVAMERLGAMLKRRGARVAYVYLPAGSDGGKVGADDFLATGKTLADIVALATNELRQLSSVGDGVCGGPEPRATVQHPPRLAFEPDILACFYRDVVRVGHVGEEIACKLLFLATMSRLLDKIVSVVMKGPSAGGKSATVDRVLSFFPDEATVSLSGMSEKALVYDDRVIAHRMLVLYEAAGMSSDFATYLLRTLLSEGVLRYVTVESTPEGLKPVTIEREGPTGLITTTTQVSLHPENETRLLSIPVDDTPAHTAAVMKAIARGDGRRVDSTEWHGLQFWLADGQRRVVVPYAEALADLIPPIAVRLRRDFYSVLGLVRAHALLHRATRDTDAEGRVLAELADYETVRELVVDLVSDGLGAQVSDATRETINAVADIVGGDHEKRASNADLCKRLELDKSVVSRRVKVAIEKGYLINDEDRRGKPARLRLGDPLPEDVQILPTVERLGDRLTDRCSVAAHSGPPYTPPTTDDNDGIDGTTSDEDDLMSRAEELESRNADLLAPLGGLAEAA